MASALVLAACAEGLPEGTKISFSFDALVVFEPYYVTLFFSWSSVQAPEEY